MPNWCYNQATFIFPNQEVCDKFLQAVKDKCLFTTFVPLDLGVDENGIEKWNIAKAIEKWGTKWEPSNFEIIETVTKFEDRVLTILAVFDTVWAPPIGFYENINKIWGIFVESQFHESGEHVFGSGLYNKSIELNKYYNYPLNMKQLHELREKIGINGVLDKFMYKEWEYLEEYWEECRSDDSFLE